MVVVLTVYVIAAISYAIYCVFAAVSFAQSADAGFVFTAILALLAWAVMMFFFGVIAWLSAPFMTAAAIFIDIIMWLTKKSFSGIRHLISRHSRKTA